MRPTGTDRGLTRELRRRAATITLLATVLFAAAPAAAQAITVSGTAAPTDTTAGAHSNFNIHIDFSGGQVKDLVVGLPPGLVGDPNATPKCTVAQLNASTGMADGCPANTQVGSVSAVAQLLMLVPVTVNGKLYNLQPQPGEPARFGIVLHPDPLGVTTPIILQSGAQLRQNDFGLNTIINNIPNQTVAPGDTTILSQDITLFGIAPGTGNPFMRNPTSCTPKSTTFSATPYSESTGNATTPAFTPTTCAGLDFSPSFSALIGPGQVGAGAKPPVTTSIDQDNGEAGLRTARVVIPTDLNPDTAAVANQCSQGDFQAGTCPPGTIVGSATASSPLLTQPLSGPVALTQTGAGLPNVGLNLQGELHLLLQGTFGADKAVTFEGLPDVPIAHFQLSFNPGVLTVGRDLCGPPAPVFHEDFNGWNGASRSLDTPATAVGGGCTPCPVSKAKKKHKKKNREAAAAKKKKHKKKNVCAKKKRKKGKKPR